MVAKAARRSRRRSSKKTCNQVYDQATDSYYEECNTSSSPLGLVIVGGAVSLFCWTCCCSAYQNQFTRCNFCEIKIKKKVYKEHRENCFTENIEKIQGFKEAPLPKECPKDENHVLYQWPDRKSKMTK